MNRPQRIVTTKRLLVALVSIILLAGIVMWALGIRLAHLKSLRLLVFSKPLNLSADEKAAVQDGLQEHAIHLTTIDARSGFDDMMSLTAMIGDARVVSLGETAHLNGSFYKAKHRLVEFLVTQMEFRVFAIEGPFGCASTVNAYILGDDNVPRDALDALAFPAWRTEEVLDMLIWMREYNSAHEDKLRFYGFDNKPVSGSAQVVYDYLNSTSSNTAYNGILLDWITRQFDPYQKDRIVSITPDVENLITYLEGRRPASGQDQAKWNFVVHNAKVLLQHLDFWGSISAISEASDMRDKHMADNVNWIIDFEKGAKTILWAGNAHITSLPGSGCMGDYLRRSYGDDMLVIALIANQRIPLSPDGATWRAGAGTLEAFLAQAGLDIAMIDFRSLPKGIAAEYIDSPVQSVQGVKTIYPLSYDAALFLESTVEAEPVASER